MGSETLPSACYILSDGSSIPFYSTSNEYNKKKRYVQVHRLSYIRYSFSNEIKFQGISVSAAHACNVSATAPCGRFNLVSHYF